MLCDNCKETLICSSVLTHCGNEIDYVECPKCGILEVMDKEIEPSDKEA